MEKYREDLTTVPRNTMDLFDNPNDKWETFYSLFMEVLNSDAPVKTKRVKSNLQPKWFTDDLRKLIKQRDHLLSKARNYPKHSMEWEEYRKFRNKVRREIRNAKRNFFQVTLTKRKANSKDLWAHLKTFNPKQSNIGPITQGNSSDKEIADLFNEHFISLLNPYHTATTTDFQNLQEFINTRKPSNTSLQFSLIDRKFVINQIKGMPDKKGTGLDEISTKILKASLPIIADPIVDIINT